MSGSAELTWHMENAFPLSPPTLALPSGPARQGGCLPSLCSLPQSSSILTAAALLPFPASIASKPPLPGPPLSPTSVFGNFPICASSNGPGHPESCLGDILASPSPTSPARLVLVTRLRVATWATRAVIGIPGRCQNVRHLSQLPSRGRAAGGTQRCPWGPLPAAATTPQCPSPAAGTRLTRKVGGQ